MSSPRLSIAAASAIALTSCLVVAAPAAGAWETTFDRAAGTCTIAFTDAERAKVNAAYATLFSEMAERTDNKTLKGALTNAANDPFFTAADAEITMTPDEALNIGGLFYGIDLYKLVMPYGVNATVERIGIETVLNSGMVDDLLKGIDLDAIMAKVDFEDAVGGLENVNVAEALKTVPVERIWGNINLGKILFNGDFVRYWFANPTTTIGQYIDRLIKSEGFANELTAAMKKSDVQLDGLIKDVLANSGVEIDAVIKRVLAQKPVRDELAKQIKNVDLDKAVNKLIMDDKGNLDVEKLLGFSIADVTLAAEDSIRAVGPQVAAPILSANDAFKACSMHSPRVKHKPAGSTVGSSGTKQNSSGDHVKGSIADGSSLDMQGVIGLGVFGLVAALLGMTALGYTLRPLIDAFVSHFQP